MRAQRDEIDRAVVVRPSAKRDRHGFAPFSFESRAVTPLAAERLPHQLRPTLPRTTGMRLVRQRSIGVMLSSRQPAARR